LIHPNSIIAVIYVIDSIYHVVNWKRITEYLAWSSYLDSTLSTQAIQVIGYIDMRLIVSPDNSLHANAFRVDKSSQGIFFHYASGDGIIQYIFSSSQVLAIISGVIAAIYARNIIESLL